MTKSVGWLAGLAVGAVISAASAVQAEPARLADLDLDTVTAGGLDDLVTLTFSPSFIGSPAEDDTTPGHAFSKHEVFTQSHVSGDGAFRTDVVVSRSIHIDN